MSLAKSWSVVTCVALSAPSVGPAAPAAEARGRDGAATRPCSRRDALERLLLVPLAAAMLSLGCTSTNPDWATNINPCCGQDLIELGIDPPEDRCADIVLDQRTARQLMADVASRSGVTHWHVRFIPGGPACIWREWPGLTDDDFIHVSPPEEVQKRAREAAQADTTEGDPSDESD